MEKDIPMLTLIKGKLDVTINFMQSRLQSKVNYHGKEGLNYKEFSSLRKYSNPQCVCA